jgi:RHS repeat-associated protein
VGFNLAYNSQNWRQDSGGIWGLGRDVGYGYGWKLTAGSLIPFVIPGSGVDHYLFVDSSGAEYRLTQNTGGVWTSKESVYVSYNANSARLYFNDGSLWWMGCVSAGTEQDGGTMYPTLMQDSNGNQVLIRYAAGGVTWANSSARILEIEDVRAQYTGSSYATYQFAYNNDPIPHLTSITNRIGTSEGYTFSYGQQGLVSPFGGTPETTTFLYSATISGIGLSYQFAANNSGELTQVTFPYGGYLKWAYAPMTYSGGVTQREVLTRSLSKDGTSGSEKPYPFSHDSGDGQRYVHLLTTIVDGGGTSENTWSFATSGSYLGTASWYEQRQGVDPSAVPLTHVQYTWTSDTAGNPYVANVITNQDPWTNPALKRVDQTLDTLGNVLQTKLYDWNNVSTPARTNTNTYLSGSNYTSRYIYNRLSSSTVTNGTATSTLVTNTYDSGTCPRNGLGAGITTTMSGAREHDDTNYWTSFIYRGNVVVASALSGSMCYNYDNGGNVVQALNGTTGAVTTATVPVDKNFAAPTAITVNSTLTQQMQWSVFLRLNSEQGPNGDTATTVYDSYARPASTTSATGAATTYTYTNSPPTVTAATNGHWTRKTLDGFGRVVLVETGYGTTTVSQSETVYDSCACSAMGRLKKQSMPHAPNASVYWTVYSYDAMGRTVSVTLPDSNTRSYSYSGYTATVTDEAAKWKKYTMDAFGNVTQVVEPDPANPGSGTYVTSYTYDLLNHLTGVSMPRPGGTQTRTFNYGNPPGAFLLSATNPENGTVAYSYTNGLLTSKTDARGIQTSYAYDGYGRVTQIQHTNDPGDPLNCGNVTLYYDTALAGGFQNVLGRLAGRQYAPTNCQGNRTLWDMYSYSAAGQVVQKKLRVSPRATVQGPPPLYWPVTVGIYADLDATWTYDNEGKVTGFTLPSMTSTTGSAYGVTPTTVAGLSYTQGYDSLGRATTLRDQNNNTVISNVTYGPAGELLTLAGMVNETRTYNSRLHLTGLNNGSANWTFAYLANGRTSQQTDAISGEQITYAYDALNRLISAVTSDNGQVPQWGQGFVYDGFGNLTDKNVTKGSAPEMHVTFSYLTNRQNGATYDANGNQLTDLQGYNTLSYDGSNRLATALGGGIAYGYDPDNRRVYQNGSGEVVHFYGVTGRRLGTYGLTVAVNYYGGTASATLAAQGTNVYFGGRLVLRNGSAVGLDQLGSIGKYFPYGEERPGVTGNDVEKFATYFRDGATGLDYAVNRYYNSVAGRFMSSDQYLANSGGPGDVAQPSSWNRYAYTLGDSVNQIDPTGLLTLVINGSFDDSPEWMDPNTAEGSAELAAIGSTFGETPTPWRWDSSFAGVTVIGGYGDIRAAAYNLAVYLNNYNFQPGESLNIVAHSHGGNVVQIAAGYFGLNHTIDNLVELGTPQNWDLYRYQPINAANNYCNVSSFTDTTQFSGASPFQIAATSYYAALGLSADRWAFVALADGDMQGFYYFLELSSVYYGISTGYYLTTKLDPYATNNVLLTSGSHSDLHTADVWNAIKKPCGLPN